MFAAAYLISLRETAVYRRGTEGILTADYSLIRFVITKFDIFTNRFGANEHFRHPEKSNKKFHYSLI